MIQVARLVLGYFKFIQDLLCSFITRKKDVAPLPDDIVIDILSRLPAYSIQQCHKVCRHWRAMTSTCHLAEMQFRRASSMIFMQCCHFVDPTVFHLLVFDEKARSFRKFNLKPEVVADIKWLNLELRSSYCGLLLFQSNYQFSGCVVMDPFTEVFRFIKFPFGHCQVCGLFFQPLASEYKILVRSKGDVDYYVYSSKSLIWRNITSGSFTFCPHVPSPVIMNQALHWMVDPNIAYKNEIDLCMHAVMVFDMVSEKFRAMPHPNIKHDHESGDHRMMHLFAKGESLYMCNTLLILDGVIEMWELKDYENWIWVKRYRLDVRMFPLVSNRWLGHPTHPFDHRSHDKISILSVNKDELLIDWFSYGVVYIVDITRKTLHEFQNICDIRHTSNPLYIDNQRHNYFTSHSSCIHPSAI